MNRQKKEPAPKAEEDIREETAGVKAAEEAEETKPQEAEAGEGTKVYCGPSVRNVVRQFTVYEGTIPAALESFLRDHPAARALLVPLEQFAETRRNLEAKGTAEAVLYKKVKSEL